MLVLAFSAYGLGIAAWQGSAMALVGDLFRAAPRAAFAHLKLTSGVASAAGFMLLPRLSLQAAALLSLCVVLIGLLAFGRLHWTLHAYGGMCGGAGGGGGGGGGGGAAAAVVAGLGGAAAGGGGGGGGRSGGGLLPAGATSSTTCRVAPENASTDG